MTENSIRLNYDADSVAEANNYMHTRARQLASEGYVWSATTFYLYDRTYSSKDPWGIETYFAKEGVKYHSVYVFLNQRGKGHMRRHLIAAAKQDHKFITTEPCKIYNMLSQYVDTTMACDHLAWREYKLIESHYRDERATRSNQYKMNHIDEGLTILNEIGASDSAKKAYMIHPMIQGDQDLKNNFSRVSGLCRQALHLALEYRNIANSFLSHMEDHIGYSMYKEIALSPLTEVNDMLIADKVQNRKDFEKFHLGTHDRSSWLQQYFHQWLLRLSINEAEYMRLNKLCEILRTT